MESSGTELVQQGDSSLTELYLETQRLINELRSSSNPRLADRSARLDHEDLLIRKLTQFDQLIESSSLFSTNEIIDDVQTSSLKYILVPYQLADALLSRSGSMESREVNVRSAQILLRKFLDRCEFLMILNELSKKELDKIISPESVFDEDRNKQTDYNALREQKIARFKREKLLEAKIERLNVDLAERRRLHAKRKANAATTVGANSIDDAPEELDLSNNERELMLLTLELTIDKAIAHVRFLHEELALIEHGKKFEHELRQQRSAIDPREATSMYPSTSIQQQQQQQELDQHHISAPTAPADKKYGSVTAQGPTPSAEPHRPIRTYNIKEHKDAAAPIPSHMKDYLRHVDPAGSSGGRSDTTPSGACTRQPESDQERLGRNWFRPNAHACEHCGDDDVTKRAEFTQYMMEKKRGGRGKLVPACPIHGNAHPAGQCPGLSAGRGGASRGALGYDDPINTRVNMVTDRAAVFRDSNPYLMELDDWVVMKQKEGDLPTERDAALAMRLQEEDHARSQRIEDGLQDDDEQIKTQREIYDEEDEAQMKARDWDEYTDHVKKGSGNKNYRK